MDINIKSNNLWIALYYGFYEKYPKTWCGLFWSLFLAILLLLFSPVVLIGVTISRIRDKKYDFSNVRVMCIVHFFVIIISFFFGVLWMPVDYKGFSWWYFFLGFCTLLTVCIATILLLASAYYIDEYINEWKEAREVLNKDKPPKEPNVLWESIKAIKSKVCPRINIIFEPLEKSDHNKYDND